MQKATFTIIGCGSSSGVPAPGNDWGKCDPKNPKNRRRRTSALVQAGDDALLIDCGPDFHAQSCDFEIRKISGILLTHGHADHIQGFSEIPSLMRFQAGNIPCFGTSTALADVRERFAYLFQNDKNAFDYVKGETDEQKKIAPVEIQPYQAFSVGDIDILPFDQEHGKDEHSLGFRFGDLIYSSDFTALDDEALSHLQGVNTWVLDCLSEEPSAVHNNLDSALRWIDKIKPRRAILTHMGKRMDYEILSSKLTAYQAPSVEPAFDGMKIDISLSSPMPRDDTDNPSRITQRTPILR